MSASRTPALLSIACLLTCAACATDDTVVVDTPPVTAPAPAPTPQWVAPTLTPVELQLAPDAEHHPPFVPDDQRSELLSRLSTTLLEKPIPAPVAAGKPWDRKSKPKYLDEVNANYVLTKAEKDALYRQGFVVSDRLMSDNYAGAFHGLYQSDMPIYVTADALLHAVYVSHDDVLAGIERKLLGPWVRSVLDTLHLALAARADAYPVEIARDLDIYLTVARRLLSGEEVPTVFDDDGTAANLVGRIEAADALAPIDLFGRDRMVDFSMYRPRGHYADTEMTDPAQSLEAYFRAYTWLSRLEFNIVSRSCRSSQPGDEPNPEETPREALVAFALSDLVAQTGAAPALDAIERTVAAFAGKREDASPNALAAVRAASGVTDLRDRDAFPKLMAAVGDQFPRTSRLHYMPQGTTTLPVITSLLGERVVGDATALEQLVHDPVPERFMVQPYDIAFALGHDRARHHLAADLTTWPTLADKLPQAREALQAGTRGEDLYAHWLRGIAMLSQRPQGHLPSFMQGPAFDDLRMASALVAYGQLRHNNVLLAGQAYDMGGCDPADVYVEPIPGTLQALLAFARAGNGAIAGLDPKDTSGVAEWFTRLERILMVLARVVDIELAGAPLPPEAVEFLEAVAEIQPASTGGPARYDGWYFQMFYEGDRRPWSEDRAGLKTANFIADYYTSTNLGQVAYIGARAPSLGLFVVDVGGPPRVLVGPVARGYAMTGPLDKRLTDAEATELPRSRQAWEADTVVYGAAPPNFALTFEGESGSEEATLTVWTRSARPQTVELVITDHHGRPTSRRTVKTGPKPKRLDLKVKGGEIPADALRVQIGEWTTWLSFGEMEWPGTGQIAVGGAEALPYSWEMEEE